MNGKAWAQLGLVAFLLTAAGMMFFRSSDRTRIDFHPYQALGTVAGEEVSKSLGGQGTIVLVIPAPGPDPDPVFDSQLAAFKASLKAHGKVELTATVPVSMDPFQRMSTGGAMPPDQFAALRAQHPNANGYVLFIGFPALTGSEMDALKGSTTRLMVVSAPLPGYETLLARRILEFAIVSKTVPADEAPPPAKTTRELFDQEYLILRPDNAGAE
ncbi:MAG: hypothetical protein AB7O66_08415 [Limisphaerales bacterium]